MYSIYKIKEQYRINHTQSGIIDFYCYGNSCCDKLYTFQVTALISYNTLVMANIINLDTLEKYTYNGGRFSRTTSTHQSYFIKHFGIFDNIINYNIDSNTPINSTIYQAFSMVKWFEHTWNFTI